MANLLFRSSSSAPIPESISVKNAPLTNLEVDGNFKSLNDDLILKAPLASPSFTGTPTAPTAAVGTNTTQLATTAFVQNESTSTNTANRIVKRDESGNFAANVITVTDLNSTSDASLKENVRGFDGLALVNAISPVVFQWKDTGETSYGVIAQELEQVLPELVVLRGDGTKGVSYIPLIALLLDAVKTLDARVKKLEKS